MRHFCLLMGVETSRLRCICTVIVIVVVAVAVYHLGQPYHSVRSVPLLLLLPLVQRKRNVGEFLSMLFFFCFSSHDSSLFSFFSRMFTFISQAFFSATALLPCVCVCVTSLAGYYCYCYFCCWCCCCCCRSLTRLSLIKFPR